MHRGPLKTGRRLRGISTVVKLLRVRRPLAVGSEPRREPDSVCRRRPSEGGAGQDVHLPGRIPADRPSGCLQLEDTSVTAVVEPSSKNLSWSWSHSKPNFPGPSVRVAVARPRRLERGLPRQAHMVRAGSQRYQGGLGRGAALTKDQPEVATEPQPLCARSETAPHQPPQAIDQHPIGPHQ